MAIDRDGVRHIARLARLELPRASEGQTGSRDASRSLMTDEDVERYRKDLDAFLNHVEQLKALDLEGVEPTSHGVPLPNRLRPDQVGPELATEAALAGAPATGHGGFLVPKVVE